MFNKEKFGMIIKKINDSYPTQYDFADHADVNRTYLSQYINLKLDSPPKPKILKKIAESSKGLTTYDELMNICGYINIDKEFHNITNSLNNSSNFFTVPILIAENGKLCTTKENVVLPATIDLSKQYFGYRATDESMSPLFGCGDIAIIQETEVFESGKTYLIELEHSIFLVRKIIKIDTKIELHPLNPYFPIMKLTNEDLTTKDFKILGKMIKSENESAFK